MSITYFHLVVIFKPPFPIVPLESPKQFEYLHSLVQTINADEFGVLALNDLSVKTVVKEVRALSRILLLISLLEWFFHTCNR